MRICQLPKSSRLRRRLLSAKAKTNTVLGSFSDLFYHPSVYVVSS